MILLSYFLMTLLMILGLFLIALILLQRGRGGGLAGALGGVGGHSALGVKAGDVFTRITVGVACAWILLCAGSVVALHNSSAQRATEFADPDVIKAQDEARLKELEKARATSTDDDLKLDEDAAGPAKKEEQAPAAEAEKATPDAAAVEIPEPAKAVDEKKPEAEPASPDAESPK